MWEAWQGAAQLSITSVIALGEGLKKNLQDSRATSLVRRLVAAAHKSVFCLLVLSRCSIVAVTAAAAVPLSCCLAVLLPCCLGVLCCPAHQANSIARPSFSLYYGQLLVLSFDLS